MSSKSLKLSFGALLSLIFVLIAYWYESSIDHNLRLRIELTLESLLNIEESVSVNPKTKIAIGFGSCLDIIVQSRDVIIDTFSAPLQPKHYEMITTREQLLEVFAYYFQFGAAAERFVDNASLFNEIVELTNMAQNSMRTIGGNAPIMATRFAKEGIGEILLGAQISPSLAKQLPSDVVVSGPQLNSDDMHILLEYPMGETWNQYESPRANRFIIHNDNQNALISSLEKFYEKSLKFRPDLIIVSGLQMMDNFPSPLETRKARIEKLSQLLIDLRKSNSNLKIHFEMASFSEESLLRVITELIFPNIDSIGMNEQEAQNLFSLFVFGNISYVSDAYPRVALVLDQMRVLYDFIKSESKGRLSRIHVHTLAFQAILTNKDSKWKHSMASMAKAALTAHRHTCGSDIIDTKKARLIMDQSFSTTSSNNNRRIQFDVKNPVFCWDEKISIDSHLISICVAPVLVCTKVLQTGGGGDNVSAAGIVLQI